MKFCKCTRNLAKVPDKADLTSQFHAYKGSNCRTSAKWFEVGRDLALSEV